MESGRADLLGRRVREQVAGELFDPSERLDGEPDAARLRALTDDLMGELDKLVADLRARYPTRWTPG